MTHYFRFMFHVLHSYLQFAYPLVFSSRSIHPLFCFTPFWHFKSRFRPNNPTLIAHFKFPSFFMYMVVAPTWHLLFVILAFTYHICTFTPLYTVFSLHVCTFCIIMIMTSSGVNDVKKKDISSFYANLSKNTAMGGIVKSSIVDKGKEPVLNRLGIPNFQFIVRSHLSPYHISVILTSSYRHG